MAEIELSILQRQCLDRRIPDEPQLVAEVGAWEKSRNKQGGAVNWQFTTPDARVRLKHLYPIHRDIDQIGTQIRGLGWEWVDQRRKRRRC